MTDPLALHGERMSMVWERSDEGVPRWRHWGTRLDAAPPCRLDEMRGAASFSLDRDRPLDLATAGGGGWFGGGVEHLARRGRRWE